MDKGRQNESLSPVFSFAGRLTMPSIRPLQFSLCFLLSLSLGGCFTMTARTSSNRSLWMTRLPDDPDMSGVTFILQDMPKAEFAYLLAQQYPESFVVAQPTRGVLGGSMFYLYNESNISNEPLAYARGGIREAVRRDLPAMLVFHQMKMVACDPLPEALGGSSCVRLSWAKDKENFKTALSSTRRFFITMQRIPSFLTLGLLFPIPMSVPQISRGTSFGLKELNVGINASPEYSILAHEDSEAGIYMGGLWSLPLSGFFEDPKDSLSPSEGFSPGGWADCLEQLFQDEKIRELSATLSPEELNSKAAWFRSQFESDGFSMAVVPSQKNERGIGIFRDKAGKEYHWYGFSAKDPPEVAFKGNCLTLISDK